MTSSTPAPPSAALMAANTWSGVGEVNTSPAAAAVSIPRPTKPPWDGSWPLPPPLTNPTWPLIGASLRTTTLKSGSVRMESGWASAMPATISLTTFSGALMSFFIFSVTSSLPESLFSPNKHLPTTAAGPCALHSHPRQSGSEPMSDRRFTQLHFALSTRAHGLWARALCPCRSAAALPAVGILVRSNVRCSEGWPRRVRRPRVASAPRT